MRSFCLGLLMVALLSAGANAQAPNSVMEHYRAYRAALATGDLAAAETAAEGALAASEASDGDGGKTAILTLNLAAVRVELGDYAGALAPAQRALAFAEAGAEGVDVNYATLVAGRAELAVAGRPGADRLKALFSAGGLGALPVMEVYTGAAELGLWATEQRDYGTARFAHGVAGAHASGSPFGAVFGLARAQTWEASAIFYDEIGRRGYDRVDVDNARDAHVLLHAAMTALRPLANIDTPHLELTVAQQALADAMALHSALSAKLRADGQTLPEVEEAQGDGDGNQELTGPIDISTPRCLVTLNPDPRPIFPYTALNRGRLGGVVLWARVNADGSFAESRVVARVGEEAFARAVERVAPRWSVIRRAESPPGCRMQSTLLVPTQFVLGTR